MIEFSCPKCSAEMVVPIDRVGEVEACPECGNTARVPAEMFVPTVCAGEAEARPPAAAPPAAGGGGGYLGVGIAMLVVGVIVLWAGLISAHHAYGRGYLGDDPPSDQISGVVMAVGAQIIGVIVFVGGLLLLVGSSVVARLSRLLASG
jgi:hypothetical protein